MKVHWRENAKLDLREIYQTIAQNNLPAARRVARGKSPGNRGTRRASLHGPRGRIENTRELAIRRYPYTVAYQVMPKRVEIIAVIHQARLWPLEF